jgi:hypothetical protein
MNTHYRRIAIAGVLAFLAVAGAGCRSQIRRQCDRCPPYLVAAAPSLTNARSVEYAKQYTAVLSQPVVPTDQLGREISGIRADINRLRREVSQAQVEINEIKTRLPANAPQKPLS